MRSASRQVALLDFMLCALASATAVWSSFMSIGRNQMALVFAAIAFVGGVVSYLMSRVLSEQLNTRLSAPLYAAVALVCVFFVRDMNALLPDGGFPLQIIFAGVFSWVVTLGSFFAWRDATMCFQAVPCIAVFGLVGAFDTYKAAPFVFFIFLLCIATLFFRAHARSMVVLAERSVAGSASEKISRSTLVQRAFESGAWRWMAGPEWAVSSALVIIALSVVGAPVIRTSVTAVTGTGIVRLVPEIANRNTGTSSGTNFTGAADLDVGRGPANLLGIEVLKVKTQNPKYLLSEVFDDYRRGWAKSSVMRRAAKERVTAGGFSRTNFLPSGKGRLTVFEIKYVAGQHNRVYFPGELLTLNTDQSSFTFEPEGTVTADNLIPPGTVISGTSRLVTNAVPPSAMADGFPPPPGTYRDAETVPAEVARLARDVTAGLTSDVEKAQAIYDEIGRRCKYNLEAPRVPSNADPVEHFMFVSKQGYCDLFASAMATMARSVGLTTRVCVGFLVRSRIADREGFYAVNDDDFHMWAEVYYEGVGWVPYDPTEVAENITPEQAKRSLDWATIVRYAGIGLAGLAILGIVIKIAFDSFGGTHGTAQRLTTSDRAYLKMQSALLKATRKPRRLNETSREYLARVGDQIPNELERAQKLFDRLEESLFSREAKDEALVQDVKRFSREVTKKR